MLEKGSYKGEGGEVGWEKGVWVGMTAPLSECSLGRKKKKEKGVGVARRGEKISLPLRLWLPVPVILNNELILMVVGQVPSSSLLARAPARTPMCTHPLPPPPRFPFAAAAAEPDCLVCNNLPSPPPCLAAGEPPDQSARSGECWKPSSDGSEKKPNAEGSPGLCLPFPPPPLRQGCQRPEPRAKARLAKGRRAGAPIGERCRRSAASPASPVSAFQTGGQAWSSARGVGGSCTAAARGQLGAK